MRLFLSFLVLCLLCALPVCGQTEAEKRRQFDFWIGEWDVGLRVQQKDSSWKDQHRAVARIYRILGGKAILELWSEKRDGINGYSLRYYDPEKDAWALWLNWPARNRSGTFGMEGRFRHGRGEFFVDRKLDEKTTQITRYTFSDITRDSLRWDDGFSQDGGRTWTSNWIMEFTRKAEKAPDIGTVRDLHTYFDGSRCDLPEFEPLKRLAAAQENGPALRLHNILDGCIVAGFIERDGVRAFFTLTYNTYANLYELAFLGDGERDALMLYYGPRNDDVFTFRNRDGTATAELVTGKGVNSLRIDYEGRKLDLDFVGTANSEQ